MFWIRKSHNFFWFFCHYTYTSLLGQGMRKFSSFPRYGIVIFHLISSLMLIILKAIIFLIFFLLHLCHLFGTIRMRKFFFFRILDCDPSSYVQNDLNTQLTPSLLALLPTTPQKLPDMKLSPVRMSTLLFYSMITYLFIHSSTVMIL